ncbi:uncharacterized protein LOC122882995 [Siniperca chuatsi]|uniref:uncharacterized protein LOC122882995 n=1 Tax=Siniperca chuatsi TaxID=119488 RepID=UPI001CE179C7|nr:uncharacterized protein LOC122882995 [Siniperca chuatsi]
MVPWRAATQQTAPRRAVIQPGKEATAIQRRQDFGAAMIQLGKEATAIQQGVQRAAAIQPGMEATAIQLRLRSSCGPAESPGTESYCSPAESPGTESCCDPAGSDDHRDAGTGGRSGAGEQQGGGTGEQLGSGAGESLDYPVLVITAPVVAWIPVSLSVCLSSHLHLACLQQFNLAHHSPMEPDPLHLTCSMILVPLMVSLHTPPSALHHDQLDPRGTSSSCLTDQACLSRTTGRLNPVSGGDRSASLLVGTTATLPGVPRVMPKASL